ncbi:MAG: exopolysaccharide biosynthesis polyprenyl glycosylphosphotransferase [Clostridia bacterium]|nr:exopolysaccharide biosynthesis polyprenyl glycosylphosphotransferase [Clostridia bacterium]
MDSIITMAVFQVELAIYIAYSFVLAILMKTYNAFDSNMSSVNEQFFSAMLSAAILNALTYVIMGVGVLKIPNPIPLLGLTACQCIVNAVWVPLCKCFGNVLYRQNSKTVIVYQTDADLQKLYDIKKYKHLFSVQKYIKNPQSIQSLIKELEGFDVVFVAGIHATLRNGIAKYCVENDICAYIEPRIGDVLLAGAKHTRAFSIPTLRVTKASPAPEYLFIKRAFDIFASALAIILTSPIMAAVAIAIKLDDGGPIFYKQKRLTKDRKEFKILKFRSMCVDAEKDGVARLTSKNDARITRVGRIIRKCRADELPQLFNILFGSMTIVGPRPERKEIAEQYEETIPAFRLRLQVKAGLTGYAQIFGRYNTHPYDKLQMDLMYINKMSIVEDLFLMMATVKILFSGKSAEGVEDGEITADTRVNEDVKESA